jgi:hypothetical protein
MSVRATVCPSAASCTADSITDSFFTVGDDDSCLLYYSGLCRLVPSAQALALTFPQRFSTLMNISDPRASLFCFSVMLYACSGWNMCLSCSCLILAMVALGPSMGNFRRPCFREYWVKANWTSKVKNPNENDQKKLLRLLSYIRETTSEGAFIWVWRNSVVKGT